MPLTNKLLVHAVFGIQQGRQREPSVSVEALRVEWRSATPPFAATSKLNNKNIKYFISSNGNRTHNLSRFTR